MLFTAPPAPLVFVIPNMQKNHFTVCPESVIFLSDKREPQNKRRGGLENADNYLLTGGNKMVGFIAAAGIFVVSGILTYEFEEKIAPKEK